MADTSHAYNTVWQLRADAWCRLEEAAERLSWPTTSGQGKEQYAGVVTDLLARRLERGERPARVVGCGPPAMLAAVARLVGRYRIPCDVSLENQMACGFGAGCRIS